MAYLESRPNIKRKHSDQENNKQQLEGFSYLDIAFVIVLLQLYKTKYQY